MGRIFAGWLIMITTQIMAICAAALTLGALVAFGVEMPPDDSAADNLIYYAVVAVSSFLGYWASVRRVIKSLNPPPASLNNSTNSECKS